MDRKRYLELCQRSAVCSDVVVFYDGDRYYPKSYIMWFDKSGKSINSGEIVSVKSGSVFRVLLNDIFEKEIEDDRCID